MATQSYSHRAKRITEQASKHGLSFEIVDKPDREMIAVRLKKEARILDHAVVIRGLRLGDIENSMWALLTQWKMDNLGA